MKQVTKKVIAEARKFLRTIPRVSGEERKVLMCEHCGKIFGRRYVRYGLGYGATYGACLDFLTNRNAPMKTLLTTRR